MVLKVTRRRVVATALLAWLGLPALASADVEWCFDDPPVQIRLPSGAPVTVNISIRVPAGRRDQLKAASVSAAVLRDADGDAIQVTALVPSAADGSFPVQMTAHSGRESFGSTQNGVAGTPLVFMLPLPAN